MNTEIGISETTSQRKDRALHCPFASIENCKPALHSHSLEHNMRIPEQPMMLARSGAHFHFVAPIWPAMAMLVSIGLSFLSIS